MTTCAMARTHIQEMLEKGGVEDARFEARTLVEIVTETRYPAPQSPLTDSQLTRLENLAKKRMTGYPLQYLCGEWEFYGIPLCVGEGVLIPRPDTETLVDAAIALRQNAPYTHLIDLCSGTGCIPIALTAHLPDVTGICVELSDAALPYLRENIARHAPKLSVVAGDVLAPPANLLADTYDIITINPPYLSDTDMRALQREVTHEPSLALYGGTDGLDFYRAIIPLWMKTLAPDGVMLLEIGVGMAEDVKKIILDSGYHLENITRDLAGIERVISAKR